MQDMTTGSTTKLTASFGNVGLFFKNSAAWDSTFLMISASYLLIICKMKKQKQPFGVAHKQEATPEW